MGIRRASTEQNAWSARPALSFAIRCAVLLGPIAVGCSAAIACGTALPPATTGLVVTIRTLFVVAVASAVVRVTDRMARRMLPLATLMRLSLVFPDQAPSRFRSALKAGSSRRLERLVEETRANGLSADANEAARQVVELIGAIGDHDRRTRGHSERVRLYAELVGEQLHLSAEDRQKLQWGALLHDLGKLTVPAEILNKPGKPTAEEWAVLQGHPAAGMALIEPMRDFLGEWVDAIGGHHEKWDGSGYPKGLKGREIPRAAAIVAVADSYEVMTALRSYKKPMSHEDARAELTRCAGQHFAPEVVRAFLKISLGDLRVVAGPLAALAHLPFIGGAAQITVGAAATPVAAGLPMISAAVVTSAAVAAPVGADPALVIPPLFEREAPAAAAAVPVVTAAVGRVDAWMPGNGTVVTAAPPTLPPTTLAVNVPTTATPSPTDSAPSAPSSAPPAPPAPTSAPPAAADPPSTAPTDPVTTTTAIPTPDHGCNDRGKGAGSGKGKRNCSA